MKVRVFFQGETAFAEITGSNGMRLLVELQEGMTAPESLSITALELVQQAQVLIDQAEAVTEAAEHIGGKGVTDFLPDLDTRSVQPTVLH